jgi:hypothetical protein
LVREQRIDLSRHGGHRHGYQQKKARHLIKMAMMMIVMKIVKMAVTAMIMDTSQMSQIDQPRRMVGQLTFLQSAALTSQPYGCEGVLSTQT